MNVQPDAVHALVSQGLAPSILEDPARQQLVLRLASEMVNYGADVLPREMFARASGVEIAASACEDVEGALWLEPLLTPQRRRVETPAPEADAGSESEAESGDETPVATEAQFEEIPPRVVHLSNGFGLPALALALLYPDQPFEVVEGDPGRQWLYRRLIGLHRTRNLRLVETDASTFMARQRGQVDLLVLKGLPPHQALEVGAPLLVPGGRLLSWHREDRSKDLRRHLHDERGLRLRLERSFAPQSLAARGRALHCVSCGVEAETESLGV